MSETRDRILETMKTELDKIKVPDTPDLEDVLLIYSCMDEDDVNGMQVHAFASHSFVAQAVMGLFKRLHEPERKALILAMMEREAERDGVDLGAVMSKAVLEMDSKGDADLESGDGFTIH